MFFNSHFSCSAHHQVELTKAYHHYSKVGDFIPGLERAQFMLGFLHLNHPEAVPEDKRGAPMVRIKKKLLLTPKFQAKEPNQDDNGQTKIDQIGPYVTQNTPLGLLYHSFAAEGM